MNYGIDEYASDVIYHLGSICDEVGVEHPTVITESGRAMTAHHSVLVFNVLGSAGGRHLTSRAPAKDDGVEEDIRPLRDLRVALETISERTLTESYHDVLQARDEASQLFKLGHLDLVGRARAEQLFWETCARALEIARRVAPDSDERFALESQLAETYICNLSVFQSLPDVWAIGQLFPVLPIHRLNERPTQRAVLGDITCDSDGKLDKFIDDRDTRTALDVHPLRSGESYYLAVFLVGAYQETLGDLHNLFGDTHAVHVRTHPGSGWQIERIVRGDTVRQVLSYVGYDADKLAERVANECERAISDGRLKVGEAGALTRFYRTELDGYTYMEPDEQ
jgi:arginine decarboxylase